MKRVGTWLLTKSNFQTYIVALAVCYIIVRHYTTTPYFRSIQDIYSPFVFAVIFIWIYYSIFFRVSDGAISITSFKDLREPFGKYLKLILLVYFGYRTFYVFGVPGSYIAISIVSMSALITLIGAIQIVIKELPNHKGEEKLGIIIVWLGVVGYLYFVPWKAAFCHDFGVEEIDNYFEKDTYKAKYIVKLINPDKGKTYTLPADILVSKDFSEYEYYITETGVGAYSYETEESSETRRVKINRVYFNNGGFLSFDDCLISVDNSCENRCTDQHGDEWKIEMTKEKAK
jgi:hypothetical protein